MKHLSYFAFCILQFAICVSAPAEDRQFPCGAVRSPAHKLLALPQHTPTETPPAQFAWVPKQIDLWGNDRFGDCVTAEECFAKACYSPEIFITAKEAERWARRHHFLNGADLVSVLTTMQTDGFDVGGQRYNDGPFSTVDYSNELILKSAISKGPVKIAIDHSALPATAGNQNGWYALGNGQQYTNTDHCVCVCAYGAADYLYSQISTPLPAAIPGTTNGYLVETWSSYGFVDHPWLMGTCVEAHLRTPTTVGVPPLSADPAPMPGSVSFAEAIQLVIAAAKPDLTQSQAAAVADFFSDDGSPRVALLRELVYRRALRQGAVPAGTPIESVNWQGLIQFMQALMPIIEQLIVLFGGHTSHAALHEATLVAYVDARPDAKSRDSVKQCGPNGCRVAPAPRRTPSLRPIAPRRIRRAESAARSRAAWVLPRGGRAERGRFCADFVRLS